jgi:hypothetical protein
MPRRPFRIKHRGEQELLLAILNGEHDRSRETPQETARITKWQSFLEEQLDTPPRRRHRVNTDRYQKRLRLRGPLSS